MQSVDATPIFYLDNEVNKQTRRSFLKKAGLALGALIFSAYTGIMTTGCKKPDGPTPPATYNLTLFPLDIFNQQGLTGNLIVNGTSKPAGSTYSIENGSISSIDAQIPGYNSAYILTRDASGNVKFTRDASGYHSITISSDSTFYAFLIPDSFDTTLFVKCTGEGNGTVQNYGKTAVNVGIMKSPTPDGMDPTPQTIANLTRSIELYNTAAVNTMKLNYLGQIDSELVDGVSHFVVNSFSLHVETLSGNTIYKSFLATHPFATPRAILEELTQAASGLRVDGGYSNFPYVSGDELNPQYVRDGARAIQLNQLLPAGFKLSTTGTPAVYIMEHPGLVSPGLITPPGYESNRSRIISPGRDLPDKW